MASSPALTVLTGPNGAGKSTAAPWVLPGVLQTLEFVNADVIAAGLSAFNPRGAAVVAGRIMLARLKELAERKVNFAFETTLASRTFAPWIQGMIQQGYTVQLIFLWLASPEMAIARVAERVRR
ncbi:MAG: zeta toxin family protein [Isosphaeraceae bacterium]